MRKRVNQVRITIISFEWLFVSSNDKKQYSFFLKAGTGEVILRREHYVTKASVDNGIASVQKNSPLDERFELKEASDGRPFFNLKAGNHQIICTSQLYAAKASRDSGIASVIANGPSNTVKTNT